VLVVLVVLVVVVLVAVTMAVICLAIIMLTGPHGQFQLRKQTKENPALEEARVLKRRGEQC
jgi:hypothetical protein